MDDQNYVLTDSLIYLQINWMKSLCMEDYILPDFCNLTNL